MYCCQQVLVGKNPELIAILKFLCEQSHKLTNMGIYYGRQLYFKSHKTLGKYDLEKVYKKNNHYKVLYSQAAQQILRTVAESFRSYYGLIIAYSEGKITNRPRIPNYRKKGGLATVSYPAQALKLKGNQIRVPLGNTCKRWFGLDCFLIPIPSIRAFYAIKELRILPRNRCFYWEFMYKKEVVIKPLLNQENVLGIDHGVNNWLTCVSNVNTSLIVDGKHPPLSPPGRGNKGVGWYNKQISTIKENKPLGFWSNRLAAITEKRDCFVPRNQIRDGINKAARIVINHCLKNSIGTIVLGWNKGQKNQIELGKKSNSEFVPIPTARLKERIAQLCDEYGIIFIETPRELYKYCFIFRW
ncbi:transposase [Okeania sp. SIO3B5]|uniref:RNA-guided endonuclease InsQ/TnpB family protein n=1 Tax=Okeania sp. SIO3B5 TaxID=2607811 RepID=UPI0025EFA3BA|nr:transposase [Okeania sp. SIO3B5]